MPRSFLFLAYILLVGAIPLKAGETSRQEYLELIRRYPKLVDPVGDYAKGEIQIILDPQEMAAIEKSTGRDVGLVKQDKYWLWINDACQFPSGHKGVYGRIFWINALDSPPGVAVMPVLPDGRIVLNCNFRHSTRSWEIELPRGGVNVGEALEDAAKREAMEETGMLLDHLTFLGNIPPDTGLTGTIAAVYMAKVIDRKDPEQEETEAIEEVLALAVDEIKQAFLKGTFLCRIRGEEKQVNFRDPFLAYALLMSEISALH